MNILNIQSTWWTNMTDRKCSSTYLFFLFRKLVKEPRNPLFSSDWALSQEEKQVNATINLTWETIVWVCILLLFSDNIIIESFTLLRILFRPLFQFSVQGRANLNSDQVAQCFVKLNLERLHWGKLCFSSCLMVLIEINFLLTSSLNLHCST